MAQSEGFWARTKNTGRAFNQGLKQTAAGRLFREATLESMGWSFVRGEEASKLGLSSRNAGFAGWRTTGPGQTFTAARGAGASSGSALQATVRYTGHQIAGRGAAANLRALAGTGGKMLLGGMGGVFTAYMMYEGYQQQGIWGAAKGLGESIAYTAGFKALAAVVGSTGVAAGAAVAAGAVGAYYMGEAAQTHMKSLRNVEMGSPMVDTFGTVATMRQRSLMALNQTHLNGRMAIGNEGALMHDGAYSTLRRG